MAKRVVPVCQVLPEVVPVSAMVGVVGRVVTKVAAVAPGTVWALEKATPMPLVACCSIPMDRRRPWPRPMRVASVRASDRASEKAPSMAKPMAVPVRDWDRAAEKETPWPHPAHWIWTATATLTFWATLPLPWRSVTKVVRPTKSATTATAATVPTAKATPRPKPVDSTATATAPSIFPVVSPLRRVVVAVAKEEGITSSPSVVDWSWSIWTATANSI
mmetsp:Transcript_3669/g.5730  ORF Transcript_3669/g.5730 Transcript_3669/m.5730 type:complete len:218 (-) Transcript_3669:2280-2933(-)